MAILFNEESSKFTLQKKTRIKSWLREVVVNEGFKLGQITIIVSDDKKLLELNKQFLSRDYLTDILTFDYSEGNTLSGDLFISLERIIENAQAYSVSNENEILRIIVHGILHLAGYKDNSASEKSTMRKMENHYLQIILDGS